MSSSLMKKTAGLVQSRGHMEYGSENILIAQMSPESQKIYTSMKWSETGFVPSFKSTDVQLLKASRKTYEYCKRLK